MGGFFFIQHHTLSPLSLPSLMVKKHSCYNPLLKLCCFVLFFFFFVFLVSVWNTLIFSSDWISWIISDPSPRHFEQRAHAGTAPPCCFNNAAAFVYLGCMRDRLTGRPKLCQSAGGQSSGGWGGVRWGRVGEGGGLWGCFIPRWARMRRRCAITGTGSATSTRV